ncbi:MAG: methyl-accepting chemotaxis protein [Lachnospiraceae bacterium]|nr:methyl-accepting chemotaxis protein [Lachnospiraceae bacterium]
MKNLPVSKKLITSFLIVVALTAIVGLVGIIGMIQMERTNNNMYEQQLEPLPNLARVSETLQRTRVSVREMVLGVIEEDMKKIEASFNEILEYTVEMAAYLDAYSDTIAEEDIKRVFESARSTYENELVPIVLAIHSAALEYDMDSILGLLEICRILSDDIINGFDKCMDLNVQSAVLANRNATSLNLILLIIIVLALVVAIAAALYLAYYISGIISKPLNMMAAALDQLGMKGDLNFAPEIMESAGECANWKDEIGKCARAFGGLIQHLGEMQQALTLVSNGDLTTSIAVLSEKDATGKSLELMVENLNQMFKKLNILTLQVTESASQIAENTTHISEGAQSLASGATEQSEAVVELSLSISMVEEKTKENVDMAYEASRLADMIIENAHEGSRKMEDMINAVNEIVKANEVIHTIINTIDSIAAQTNMLSLNAAIEAARAGEQGKGFAVVAQEVNSLATQSADASRQISSIIKTSMEKSELGTQIVSETAKSFSLIVEGVEQSNQLIKNITNASEGQAQKIAAINEEINHVSDVIRQNSATAEESAAAAEESAAATQEMSNQALILKDLVAEFRLK